MDKDKVYHTDLSYPIDEEPKCLVYRVFGQVPARLVLYMLSWSGFLVSFMMRTDINLAIVAMVREPERPHFNGTLGERYCYDTDTSVEDEMTPVTVKYLKMHKIIIKIIKTTKNFCRIMVGVWIGTLMSNPMCWHHSTGLTLYPRWSVGWQRRNSGPSVCLVTRNSSQLSAAYPSHGRVRRTTQS